VLQIDAKRSLPHGQHSSPKSKKIFVGGLAPETNEGKQRCLLSSRSSQHRTTALPDLLCQLQQQQQVQQLYT
jgi:hypothetical protein